MQKTVSKIKPGLTFQIGNHIIENINTILFDKDGTIIDSNLYWGEIINLRAKYICEKYMLEDEKCLKLCELMGWDTKKLKLKEEGPIAITSRDEVIRIVENKLQNWGIELEEREISTDFSALHQTFAQNMHHFITILPGVHTFLKLCFSYRIKMAIITSDTVLNTKQTMEYLNCDKYFMNYIGKDSCPFNKSTGKPASMALEMLRSRPQNTLCIGDTESDILMAKNAGTHIIAVASGQVKVSSLKKYTDFVIENINEIQIKS